MQTNLSGAIVTESGSRKNVDLVLQAIAAVGAGDAESFLGAFAADIDYRLIGSTPVSARGQGIDGWTKLVLRVGDFLSEPVKLDVSNIIAAGDFVVTEATGDAVTTTGKRYANEYCLIWQLRDGKIVRFTEYCDTDLINTVLSR
jgi:ketosteroid isomerase-like protein